MRSLYVNGQELVSRCRELMDGDVKYKLGAKARPVTCEASSIAEIDCSGFVQYIMYHCCSAQLHAGSWHQNKWFEDQQFEQLDYARAAPLNDDCLRLGYFPRKAGMAAGHIWFVLNGNTVESYSGGTKHGPGRRPWDTRALRDNVEKCYRIGECKQIVHDELAAMCRIAPMQMAAEF